MQDFKVKRTAALPFPMMYSSALSINKKIYLFGGWSEKGFLDEILELNLSGDDITVKTVSHLPEKQGHLAAVTTGDSVFLIGGADIKNDRQLRVACFYPKTYALQEISLKSYSWW